VCFPDLASHASALSGCGPGDANSLSFGALSYALGGAVELEHYSDQFLLADVNADDAHSQRLIGLEGLVREEQQADQGVLQLALVTAGAGDGRQELGL